MGVWNSADKSAGVTISGAGSTIATDSVGVRQAVRGIPGHGNLKYYMEFTITNLTATSTLAVGVADLTYYLGDNLYADAAAMTSAGTVWVNQSSSATGLSFTTGDRVDMAVDIGNKMIWFRVNGGNWNGNAAYNPATNTGGIALTALGWTWTNLFPMTNLIFVGDSVTANFGDTSFIGTPPSGFLSWASPLALVASAAVGLSETFVNPTVPAVATAPGKDITLSWKRRDRVTGSSTFVTTNVPMNELVEAYEVDIIRNGLVARTIAGITSPTCVYTAAMQAADGWTILPPQLTLRVYQMSAVVGRGFTHEVTVDVN